MCSCSIKSLVQYLEEPLTILKTEGEPICAHLPKIKELYIAIYCYSLGKSVKSREKIDNINGENLWKKGIDPLLPTYTSRLCEWLVTAMKDNRL